MTDSITKWPEQSIERDRSVPESGEGCAQIQWKGTNVCMDVKCRCGAHGHVDAEFAYFYKCLACGTTFALGVTVRLYPMDEACAAARNQHCVKVDEDLAPLVGDGGDSIAPTPEEGSNPKASEPEQLEEPREQCGDCGAEILGYHACQGVPGGFGEDA